MTRRIHSPDSQRRDAAKEVLRAQEAACTQWVCERLPGAFAEGVRRGLFPTAALFVTDEVDPLTEEAEGVAALRELGLSSVFDSWRSDEWPAGRLALPRSWREEDLRLIFATRRSHAFGAVDSSDPTTNWHIAYRADELVRGLLIKWSLSSLLDGYHQNLARDRDIAARAARSRPVRDLKRLRDFVRRDAFDMLTAASEITEIAEDKFRFAYNVIEFQYARTLRNGVKPELVTELREGLRRRCALIANETGRLLKALETGAEMTQTISNIRVQRALLVLTLASLAVAVTAILIAVATSGR